jgi:hypothetical protein
VALEAAISQRLRRRPQRFIFKNPKFSLNFGGIGDYINLETSFSQGKASPKGITTHATFDRWVFT